MILLIGTNPRVESPPCSTRGARRERLERAHAHPSTAGAAPAFLRSRLHLTGRRIRKTFMNGAHVAMIGEHVDLTYPTEYLGDSPDALAAILKGGKDKEALLNKLKGAQRPAVIVGPGVLGRPDRDAVLQQVRAVNESVHGSGLCHCKALLGGAVRTWGCMVVLHACTRL